TSIANWLPKILQVNQNPISGVTDPGDTEANFVGICWAFPWERLRRERLERCLSQRERVVQPTWFSPLHPPPDYGEREIRRFEQQERGAITTRRMRVLQLALHWFHDKNGRYPTTLAELTPHYLGAIPRDPFGNGPL